MSEHPPRCARRSTGAPAAIQALALAVLPALVTGEPHEHHADGHGHETVEEIVVQATRSRRRVQDEPIRVEVINQEEIDEKVLMRPGNISMLLAETGGLRVQVTSSSLGSSNIRVHGMRGRYTQLLADGLPLYGGQAASLGLLQVPPSDLGRVEIIKGAASALYGGQALGGLINLVSRQPDETPTAEVILNATTEAGQDASAYGAAPLSGSWRGSMLSTYNHQTSQDLDGDGWIDMPGYERVVVRPRLFWTGQNGGRAFVTLGMTSEQRTGGTRRNAVAPDGQPFAQNQDTRRLDGGFTVDQPLGERTFAHVRSSVTSQRHGHRFGALLERDRHRTLLAEAALSTQALGAAWVGGVAFQADDYDSAPFPAFDYAFEAPALFLQVDRDLGADVSFVGSARLDDHDTYGGQFSPRISVLYRPGPWTVRASWGRGFHAPTPFVEETEAAGLSRLEALANLRAETAQTASLDFGYAAGAIEAGLTVFGSDIDDAVRLETLAEDRVRLRNVNGVTRTRGAELLLRWRRAPFVVTSSYLFVDATEPDAAPTGRRVVPLTPRHSAGVVAMWEQHDRGRVGLEVYYTGRQHLEDDPFRSRSETYVELGLLGEIVLGRYRLFLNLENLLNVRQTRDDPLVRPTRTPDGRWTVDAWAPLEGFVANAGVRIRLGG